MIKGFNRIFILILVFGLAMGMVSATPIYNPNLSVEKVSVNSTTDVLGANNSTIVASSSDELHTVEKKKKELPTISMWAKPSVYSSYSYRWYKMVWIDYCPNCHRYNSLLKNPKKVAEGEYTCKWCDSDFCAVTGKEKQVWSNKYLRRA